MKNSQENLRRMLGATLGRIAERIYRKFLEKSWSENSEIGLARITGEIHIFSGFLKMFVKQFSKINLNKIWRNS